MPKPVLLLGLLALLALARAQDTELPCPVLRDGESGADRQVQVDKTSLAVHWDRLPLSVLMVEVAVVSQDALQEGGGGCYSSAPFLGLPDVQGWTLARQAASSLHWRDMHLAVGEHYYAVMRLTTGDGHQVYACSDGIQIVEEETVQLHKRSAPANTHSRSKRHVVSDPIFFGATCAIDIENRCRQSKERVGDKLNNLYGPPEWRSSYEPFRTPEEEYSALRQVTGFVDPDHTTPTVKPQNWKELRDAVAAGELLPYVDNHHDDDDTASSASQAIPGGYAAILVVGILLLLLLALLILAALLFMWFGRASEEEKWSQPEARREPEPVEAAAAERAGDAEEGPDNTRVEFPDIDPGARLSVAS